MPSFQTLEHLLPAPDLQTLRGLLERLLPQPDPPRLTTQEMVLLQRLLGPTWWEALGLTK